MSWARLASFVAVAVVCLGASECSSGDSRATPSTAFDRASPSGAVPMPEPSAALIFAIALATVAVARR